jgi:hypothetical protein
MFIESMNVLFAGSVNNRNGPSSTVKPFLYKVMVLLPPEDSELYFLNFIKTNEVVMITHETNE